MIHLVSPDREETTHDRPPRDGATPAAAVIDRLAQASDEIRVVAGNLLWMHDIADHNDLYRAGGALRALTGAVEEILGHLALAAGHYSRHNQLRDDSGANPVDRLSEAVGQLLLAQAHYRNAYPAVSAYHSAISHIGLASNGQP